MAIEARRSLIETQRSSGGLLESLLAIVILGLNTLVRGICVNQSHGLRLINRGVRTGSCRTAMQ